MDKEKLEALRINPNPRFVGLLDYALRSMGGKVHDRDQYGFWLEWAAAWLAGERSPQGCVNVARRCFDGPERLMGHTLGQLAWAGKEACYDTPKSGWLVVRYVADAMIAFGGAFQDDFLALPPPTERTEEAA